MAHLWNLVAEAVRDDTALHLPAQGQRFGMGDLLRAAERTAGRIAGELGGRSPGRIGLLLNNGEAWVRAALATWRLDAAVVPLPLPVAFGGADAYAGHLRRIGADAGLDAVLVGGELGRRVIERVAASLDGARVIDVGTPDGEPGVALPPPPGDGGEGVAVIQYTSGSTSRPKGVLLTHANVVAGLSTISDVCGWTDPDVMGLWLPLFHDMGLFSMMSAFVRGSSVCLWEPGDFVRRPLRWLAQFAQSPSTALPAPNFFYDYLVAVARKDGVPDELDLSGWRIASNGAEPVQAYSLEAFAATFAPYGLRPGVVHPTYGMAEATLMVSFPERFTPVRCVDVDREQLGVGRHVRQLEPADPHARTVVSCGRPVPAISLRIGDAAGVVEPEGVVGEIQITGPAVTSGYLGLPEQSQPFTPDGWLRTGDLGFLLDGELYVTGRLKDMIVIRGQNYYAEDVEEIVRTTPGVERRRCAAFAFEGDDIARMVVLWETRLPADAVTPVIETVRQRLLDHLGLGAVEVVPVPPASIPFTSSGKVKRNAALEVWRARTPAASPAPTAQDTTTAHDARDGAGGTEDAGGTSDDAVAKAGDPGTLTEGTLR